MLEILRERYLHEDNKELNEHCIRGVLATAYAGTVIFSPIADILVYKYIAGVDTTSGVLDAFLVAMIIYPEVQQAAQQEIDGLLHGRRLPSMADRPNLPYLNALVLELLRYAICCIYRRFEI